MKIIKKAFTLAEVLVSMTIIGVIMAVSVQTIKIVQISYTSLAYFELQNLNQIAGELMGGLSTVTLNDEKGRIPDTTTRKIINGKSTTVLVDSDETICRAMVAMSNVATQVNKVGKGTSERIKHRCDDLRDTQMVTWQPIPDNTEYVFKEPAFLTGDAFIFEGEEENVRDLFDPEKPTFVTSNGKRYYLSSRVGSKAKDSERGISEKYGYRLIGVDINSSRKPNKVFGGILNRNKLPDIVTFVMLDNGQVFPLNVAADNVTLDIDNYLGDKKKVTYILSKVKGYYFSEDKKNERQTKPVVCNQHLFDDKGQEVKDENGEPVKQCDFGVFELKNTNNINAESGIFSYREAYCYSLGNNINNSDYSDYCKTENGEKIEFSTNYCPPSNEDKAVDECRIKAIKPVFRYNL